MSSPPESPALAPSGPLPAPRDLPLPARIGMTLVEPRQTLARVEVMGGGLRDVAWLVLIGIVCFRLEDVTRALLGITHLSIGYVVRHMLSVVSFEVREATLVVLPAALAVTLAAGRGRRDPSRDLELGALAYVPFFSVRAFDRTLDLEAFFGPMPLVVEHVFTALAFLWACVFVGMAIATARRREIMTAKPDPIAPLPVAPAAALAGPRLRSRITVAALGALLGAALFVNAGWVARHADAIAPLARGKSAPNFSLARVDGKAGHVTLADLHGKVVLIDFWASWCQPCVQMLPTLHRLYEEWREKGVEFVGVNSDGPAVTPEELKAFLAERPAPYPIVIDRDGTVGGQYKVVALPHIVVVGRDGSISRTFWGVTSAREIAGVLATETAAPPR